MADFFNTLAKKIKDDDTDIAGKSAAEFSGWLDTGSYSLNAQLSGSIYGGAPNHKVIGIAGEQATGKTFFALSMLKEFQDNYPGSGGFYFDTEAAVTKKMMEDRGIDSSRVIVSQPVTVEDFRHKCMVALDKYLECGDDRPPMMMVLDSLGNLSTNKEIGDITAGSDTRDMTRSALIKGAFRALTSKLAKARVPMIVTNHTYDTLAMYSPKEISGGSGLKFAASTIITLTKAKDREGSGATGPVIGNIITSTTYKSRFTKEQTKAKIRLSYTTGLDRYYGLVDLALEGDVFKQVSKKVELPNGKMYFRSQLENEPEKYFTPDILKQIDKAARQKYCYGNDSFVDLPEVEEKRAGGTTK